MITINRRKFCVTSILGLLGGLFGKLPSSQARVLNDIVPIEYITIPDKFMYFGYPSFTKNNFWSYYIMVGKNYQPIDVNNIIKPFTIILFEKIGLCEALRNADKKCATTIDRTFVKKKIYVYHNKRCGYGVLTILDNGETK